MLLVLEEDESCEAVCASIDALEDLTKKLGPAFIDGVLKELTNTLLKLLEKKGKCFGFEDAEEEF